MDFVPRPYQSLIIDHILRHPRANVWAGMGLGKTVATLTAFQILRLVYHSGPALVLAPLRVAQSTWPDEVRKWDHLRGLKVSVMTGSAAARRAALQEKADLYCTNYESIPWLVEELDGEWPFGVIIADEATRLKSFRLGGGGSKRAKALSKVAFRSPWFIELTGTPAPNGYGDLWGQMYFLDKGKRLGSSMRGFQERWFRPVRLGAQAFAVRWDILPGSEEDIQRRVADLTIKLNAEDWFNLEEPIVADVKVKLPASVMKAYKEIERDMFASLEDGTEVEAVNAAAKTGKCLQFASGAVYKDEGGYSVVHEEKIQALKSIVEEAAGASILVAYQFKHEADRILKAFPKAKLLDKDPQTIRDWNAGKIEMLLAHPASCGHGLSLQDGGCILVFFGTGWNLEEHDQMVERIGPTRQRQAGHPRSVFIYNLVAEKTLDEVVQTRIKTKREVLDLLMERKKA